MLIFVNKVMSCLPTAERLLAEMKQKQAEDEVCEQLKEFCKSGWPNKHDVPVALRPYFSVSAELTVQYDILMLNNRTVVPLSLHQYVLARLYTTPGDHKVSQKSFTICLVAQPQ